MSRENPWKLASGTSLLLISVLPGRRRSMVKWTMPGAPDRLNFQVWSDSAVPGAVSTSNITAPAMMAIHPNSLIGLLLPL